MIEAGSFYELSNSNTSQIPAYGITGTQTDPSVAKQNPLVNWGDVTVPQAGLAGRNVHYPQGKTFGGGSSRNLMVYQRGTTQSYQKWATQVGDNSFTYPNLLKYFKKSVQFTPPNVQKRGGVPPAYDPNAFSAGGPLQVSYANYLAPFATGLSRAFQKLGLGTISGFNSGDLIGTAEIALTVDPAGVVRSSAETSFLQDAIYKTNVQLYQLTMAEKILFDGSKTATGVQINTGGVQYALNARKEVILAAGVFRSPQMLMLSGVGPVETLSQFSIPAVSTLEGVGQNMMDQILFGLTYKVNVTTLSRLSTDQAYYNQAVSDYRKTQTGPLSFPGSSIIAFEKVPTALRSNLSDTAQQDLASFPSDWPDFEILPAGSAEGPVDDATAQYMAINMVLLSPMSRGNVTLASTDPADKPLINPNWLSAKTDQEVAVAAFKRGRQIAAATGITVGAEQFPGPTTSTDAQMLEFVQSQAGPIWHASATCAMGKKGDSNAVVDTNGHVFGVSKLRIVDASVFPFLPPGHCQSTVYALAEKFSDQILAGQ